MRESNLDYYTDLDKIKKLLDSYGIEDIELGEYYSDGLLNPFSIMTTKPHTLCKAINAGIATIIFTLDEITEPSKRSQYLYELNNLLEFLISCFDSDITLTGDITNPQENQVKGTALKIQIKGDELKDFILAAVVHELKRRKIKQDELDLAVDLKNKEKKYNKNEILGEAAVEILTFIVRNDILGEMSKTKKYSLVYDLLVLFNVDVGIMIQEDGFSGSVGREKYQQVRNWITASKKSNSINVVFTEYGFNE
jgi:hypothetical protein